MNWKLPKRCKNWLKDKPEVSGNKIDRKYVEITIFQRTVKTVGGDTKIMCYHIIFAKITGNGFWQ